MTLSIITHSTNRAFYWGVDNRFIDAVKRYWTQFGTEDYWDAKVPEAKIT